MPECRHCGVALAPDETDLCRTCDPSWDDDDEYLLERDTP